MHFKKEKLLKALGKLIRQRRTALSISQEELGFRANIDRTYISGLERGIRNPTLTILIKVAQALEVPVSELISNIENEARKNNED